MRGSMTRLTESHSIFWDIYPSVIFYTGLHHPLCTVSVRRLTARGSSGVGALVACLDLLPSTNYGIHLPSTMLTVLGVSQA